MDEPNRPSTPLMSPRFDNSADEIDIEAESSSENTDADSTLGDSIASYTTSLSSSITAYRYENGRRYHAFRDGIYFMPNDEPEIDRMNRGYQYTKARMGGCLHHAPLPSDRPIRILDLGTGTGLWAIDMADAYPNADVLGNDLSPIQPTAVPPNVRFEVDDIEAAWTHPAPFDLIHAQVLAGCIRDWPALMRQAYSATAPGGWVEFVDFDGDVYAAVPGAEFSPQGAFARYSAEVAAGMRSRGLDHSPGPKLERWVREAGFGEVHHRVLATPLGMWAKGRRMKELGAVNLMLWLEGLEAIGLRMLTAIRGFSAQEAQEIIEAARKDLKNPKLRSQVDIHVVWARRPFDEEV